MTDSIDAVRAELTRRGRGDDLQWAETQSSWHEGTTVCSRDGGGVLLRRLGRGESEDRVERFDTEEAAAAHLRQTLLEPTVRRRSAEEAAESRARMEHRAAEIKARLDEPRSDR
jgi:hypothetical protein